MRLSGIDPGIIRELSGIYKPFVKAFKELVSNAYDADAKNITVTLADDFSSIEVQDDGTGMSPYQFYNDFARLGGSSAWTLGGKSPGGRERIGFKGIGFLAVARYCKELHVESRTSGSYAGSVTVARRNKKRVLLTEHLGELVPPQLIRGHLAVTRVIANPLAKEPVQLRAGRDFDFAHDAVEPFAGSACGAGTRIDYKIDCSHLRPGVD